LSAKEKRKKSIYPSSLNARSKKNEEREGVETAIRPFHQRKRTLRVKKEKKNDFYVPPVVEKEGKGRGLCQMLVSAKKGKGR